MAISVHPEQGTAFSENIISRWKERRGPPFLFMLIITRRKSYDFAKNRSEENESLATLRVYRSFERTF